MVKIKYPIFVVACFINLFAYSHAQGRDGQTSAAKNVPSYHASVPQPTIAKVKYGKHERQVLDFWKAKSTSPTPLVLVIHGGGWKGGSKEKLHASVNTSALLKEGISVVSINYRLINNHKQTVPPVKAPLHDAARALQFIRSKAAEWNIDKERIGAAGGSAGACSCLWLLYNDDLADPKSRDPIARESTRLWCAAVRAAQTTLDPKQMKEWTPNSSYGAHAFGMKNGQKDFQKFLDKRDSILPWIEEFSPYGLVTADDPPVALYYKNAPDLGQPQKDPTHTANFGVKLQERCLEVGIECQLKHNLNPNKKYKNPTDYLIDNLK